MGLGLSKPNLFESATRELSHGAFVHWVLESAASEKEPGGPYSLLAVGLLSGAVPHEPVHVTGVAREYPLPKKTGRIDLLAVVCEGNRKILWGVETKLRSTTQLEQLHRYHQGLESLREHGALGQDQLDEARLTLYSTRHIQRVRVPDPYLSVDREAVRKALEKIESRFDGPSDWLVHHYAEWLNAMHVTYDPWFEPGRWDLYVGGRADERQWNDRVAEIVQHQFFVVVFGDAVLDRLFSGRNRGGAPFTQLRLTRKECGGTSYNRTVGKLFYRLDTRRKGKERYPYLELRHYTETTKPSELKTKEYFGQYLRDQFTRAVETVLIPSGSSSFVDNCSGGSAKTRETALCGFHFHAGAMPSLASLAETFLDVHRDFERRILQPRREPRNLRTYLEELRKAIQPL